MNPGIARTALGATLALVMAVGCKGAVNDDVNFFVLTFRSSTDAANAQANGPSSRPAFTPDGRYLFFESRASSIAPGDSNNKADIFRKDLSTGEVIIVSLDSTGAPSNGDSSNVSVSPDGNFAAFESTATNLVPGDLNTVSDIFVRDIQSGTTVRASVDSANAEVGAAAFRPDISADGRFVVFDSFGIFAPPDTGIDSDVYVRDLQTGTTTLVSVDSTGGEATGQSARAAISDDGSVIAFDSTAADILPAGQDTNGFADVFVIIWQAPIPIIERISVEHPTNPDGDSTDGDNPNGASRRPELSADGRFVAFISDADDLVVGDSNRGDPLLPVTDIFVRDRVLGNTTRASVSSQGSEPTRSCIEPAMSANGRWVVFTSDSPDLVVGDTNSTSDIFLRDLVLGVTIRVSVATYGVQSADFFPNVAGTVSGDGRLAAFASTAPNLAPNDTNGFADIYVRGPMY